jgi:hypothetical protein
VVPVDIKKKTARGQDFEGETSEKDLVGVLDAEHEIATFASYVQQAKKIMLCRL